MKLGRLLALGLHVAVSIVLAVVTAGLSFCVLDSALRTARAETLQAYIRVRSEREQTLFDEARVFLVAAENAFRRRLAHVDQADIDSQFDTLFPPFGDGTRRSAPSLFDGQELPGGDYVHGVGAFMGDGEAMTPEDERRYLAAFHAVRAVGEAHLGSFSSLYYFTPDRRVVIFAPEREDRLLFYRVEAPADFQLQADEDPRLFSQQTNPRGDMQCTRLSRYVYRDEGERTATACRMPMRDNGVLLGAFGTSISMTDYLTRSLELPPPGGVNMMFDREGNVIARGNSPHAQSRVQADPNAVMALLRDDPRPRGIVQGPDPGQLIAFNRIAGPDWFFVSIAPMGDIDATAAHWARIVFAIVFASTLVFAGLRGLVSRRRRLRRRLRTIRARPARQNKR